MGLKLEVLNLWSNYDARNRSQLGVIPFWKLPAVHAISIYFSYLLFLQAVPQHDQQWISWKLGTKYFIVSKVYL